MSARRPPYSDEMEQGVLGSIMLDCNLVMDLILQHEVVSESFYVPGHRLIFDEILKIYDAGRTVEILSLTNALTKSGNLEKVGGVVKLDQILDNTPTVQNAGYYIEEVKSCEKKRRLIAACMEAIDFCYEPDVSGDQAMVKSLDKQFEIAQAKVSQLTNCEAINLELEKWKKALKGEYAGLPCFLPEVNELLGCFRFGKPYYVGAQPGFGKSTAMGNLFEHWAVDLGVPCAINSIEMEHSEFLGRIVAKMADVSSFALDVGMEKGNFKKGSTRMQKVYEAASILVDPDTGENKVPLYINERQMDIDELCIWTRMMKQKHGIKALGIDYMQIIPEKKGFKGSEREAIVYATKKLRELAKELGIVIIGLSQLTWDKMKSKKPRPSDLFGSKSLEQTAYGIIMIYDQDYEDSNSINNIVWDIQKNRGGMRGKVEVEFVRERQRFETPMSRVKGSENARQREFSTIEK